MKISLEELSRLNEKYRELPPENVISEALNLGERPVLTTNFRPYEVAILHAVNTLAPGIPVIWCDTGYNTADTYRHARELIDKLSLNIKLYVPRQTKAYRDILMGIPAIHDPRHALFTEQVKLEPFKRAMEEHQPDIWFTNLRIGQTALRDSLDLFSMGKTGILKVSPFYHWTDARLDAYLSETGLPNEHRYFDPTKVLENRECGLHT